MIERRQKDLWDGELISGAQFSPDRKYRYGLWRIWMHLKPLVFFIGLNPSTADETANDPTIRRCIGFAKRWNYGGIYMGNLFAYRAGPDPAQLKAEAEPIGRDNDKELQRMASEAKITVAAWGNWGTYRDRGAQVLKLIPGCYCLGVTKAGQPKHPLYLPGNSLPATYSVEV